MRPYLGNKHLLKALLGEKENPGLASPGGRKNCIYLFNAYINNRERIVLFSLENIFSTEPVF